MATAAELLCSVVGILCPEPAIIETPNGSEITPEYNALPQPEAPPAPPPPPQRTPANLIGPERIDFGQTEVDEDVQRDITLVNNGEEPIQFRGFEMAGSTSFATSGVCPPMRGGEDCKVTVLFRPDAPGPASATIIILWNNEVKRIELTGRGKAAPPPPRPVARPAPPPVDRDKERQLREARDALAFALAQPVNVRQPAAASQTLSDGDLAQRGNPWVISQPTYPGPRDEGEFGGDVSTFPIERCRTMKRDYFVPLVLNQTLNTQIAGPINAHVDRDVFSMDGRLVLLPKGTKFIGKFQPLEKQGDTRVSAEWEEIIRPDGASIVLTQTGAADAMGRSGLTGVVDNRFFEKYGTVIAASAISASIAFATQGDTTDDGTTTDGTFTAAGQALTQSLGQVTAEALRNAANLAPRVTVAKGTLIHAIPGRQWYFPNAYQIVDLGGPAPNFTFDCTGDFFRDLRGVAQNPSAEARQ